MNIEQAAKIRRFAGGAIDYDHYSTLARQARGREFRAIMRGLSTASKQPARLWSVLAACVSMLSF